jgi:hypothetical protein
MPKYTKTFISFLVTILTLSTLTSSILAKNNASKGSNKGRDELSQESEKDKNYEHRSEVAKYVQELLKSSTAPGGIGQQVRVVAQAQNNAQVKIENQLGKLLSRNKVLKFFAGSDSVALNELSQQTEQTRLRIRELEQIRNQGLNSSDQFTLDAAINALNQQVTDLQETLIEEGKTSSIFGWLLKRITKITNKS